MLFMTVLGMLFSVGMMIRSTTPPAEVEASRSLIVDEPGTEVEAPKSLIVDEPGTPSPARPKARPVRRLPRAGALGEADKLAAMTTCLQNCAGAVGEIDDTTGGGSLGRCRADCMKDMPNTFDPTMLAQPVHTKPPEPSLIVE